MPRLEASFPKKKKQGSEIGMLGSGVKYNVQERMKGNRL